MGADGDRSDRIVDSATDLSREAELARHLLRQRRKREIMIGAEHFSDPVWDMMLDLFAAQVHGGEVAASSLFIASTVPQSTALRRIRQLVRSGYFVARSDPHDGRRTFVRLSDEMFRRVADFLRQCIDGADSHTPSR